MFSTAGYAAWAAMVSAACGYVLGEMPSQTIGVGIPLLDILPTQAPSLELVKKQIEKRAITNTCSEWTILGGGGVPICAASNTCLFTTASDKVLYEGCGQTGVPYHWTTVCRPVRNPFSVIVYQY